MEKVKKEKRLWEVSPEEGSQFYQPEKEYEEVTRTYKNDEFFAQVLKQGQSPKSQGRRLAVTGEPGSGKTTLLQKIAQWVAAETERDVAIWVSFADLQGRSVEEYLLQKWLKDALRAVEVTPEMKKALELLFNSGRVWLLLDGVDEMGSSNPLATVANQISGWVASARVVVTCRQNVWDAGKNALEGFDVYRNLDFDYPEGVGQFIQRWFARYPELGERLLAELAQDGKERIRDTVRNPLRLALLCRAWQIRQGGLPETKAGLYGQFAEALYEWKQEAFPTKSKQRKDLNAGLGRLALRGMEQSESRFRLREGLVTEVLGETDEPLCQLALQLGWLNLVGVAVENPGERVYAFYHPTFQEYFAALAVDDWGYFLHHVPDNPSLGTYRIFEKQWKEVILLWFGRENMEKEKKEAFIEKLVKFDDGCGEWDYWKVDKGFYEYRAYFLGGIVVSEFKESRFADAIVSQIVEWAFPEDASSLFKPIKEEARAVLLETDRERAIPRLNQLLKPASNTYELLFKATDFSFSESLNTTIQGIIVDILAKISGKNLGNINRLIEERNQTLNKNTNSSFNKELVIIAGGNEEDINYLLLIIEKTLDKVIISDVKLSDVSYIWKYNVNPRIFFVYPFGKAVLLDRRCNQSLTLLANQTSDDNIYSIVTNILGEIVEGNQVDINNYPIELIDKILNEKGNILTNLFGKKLLERNLSFTDSIYIIVQILAERRSIPLDIDCWLLITYLIQMLIKTKNEITSLKILNLLNKTLSANIIKNLILSIFVGSFFPYLREIASEYLAKIAEVNGGVRKQLIQILNRQSDSWSAIEITKILCQNTENEPDIINELIKTLKPYNIQNRCFPSDEIAEILCKVEGKPNVIHGLIQLLYHNESTRMIVAERLSEIAVGDRKTINQLVETLLINSDENFRRCIVDILGKIAIVNQENTINNLVQRLNETSDESTCWRIAEALGILAVGNENAIAALLHLLEQPFDVFTRIIAVDSLGKIARGKLEVINRLRQLLDGNSNELWSQIIAESLEKNILTKQLSFKMIFDFKANLTNNISRNKFYIYKLSFNLIWKCAENLSYDEFYMAWHQKQSKTWPKVWEYLNRPIF
ncbi:NACHT domain-containing protein [Microcoleus sp. N9_B4]